MRPGRILASTLGGAGFVLLVVVLSAWWAGSRLPAAYSVDSMGVVDLGLDPQAAGGGHGHGGGGPGGVPAAAVSMPDLRADPARSADVRVELTAHAGPVVLADGRTVQGYSLNGASPGPVIRAVQGDLVEVVVRNESVAAGMTLHWHGMRVPNAADGVAGVTQDAIAVGQTYVYRFVARDAGTYWYHSHQVSHEQVLGGLLGAVVVQPAGRSAELAAATTDVVALVHTYGGVRTINGRAGQSGVPAALGAPVRVRVINTDNGPMPVWVSGAPFRVVAIDGAEMNQPELVERRSVVLTAGARADLLVQVPAGRAARVEVAGASLLLGDGEAASAPAPREQVDLLSYGRPAEVGFDPEAADRVFQYRIGRRFGFLGGRPGMWWTVNGAVFPDVPVFVIGQGEVGRFTIINDSGKVHPMHLHGHRMLVLSRNGVPATGSPWWVDSLNVEPGQTYETAFLADNPGIWMDHCHNLPHAADGLVAHLMYQGVTTPFVIGGDHANEPE